MDINMDDSRIVSIAQLEYFLKVSSVFNFTARSRKDKYEWINNALNRFSYLRLKKKKDKATVKQYIRRLTGISKAQLKRLIKKKRKTGTIRTADSWGRRNTFPVIYQPADIALLLRVDSAHRRLSGPATKQILIREYEIYHRKEFANLKNISIPHIYNLRATRQYQSKAVIVSSTQAVQRNIGERKKPRNGGKPGYLRVDTVHQGDTEDEKGLYHINLTDEVTQWEVVGCCRTISEKDLVPLLEHCLLEFPFAIINFHSDNGGEFINYKVAAILNRLLIKQTKSRSRHSNDNALAEGKNGAVIRKWMGH